MKSGNQSLQQIKNDQTATDAKDVGVSLRKSRMQPMKLLATSSSNKSVVQGSDASHLVKKREKLSSIGNVTQSVLNSKQ